eukprot:228210-Pyramimonas_sp.AAC.1
MGEARQQCNAKVWTKVLRTERHDRQSHGPQLRPRAVANLTAARGNEPWPSQRPAPVTGAAPAPEMHNVCLVCVPDGAGTVAPRWGR